MAFSNVDDIPHIDAVRIDVRKVDAALIDVVESTRFALKPPNLKKRTKADKELTQLVKDQLLVFITTHKSIRILLRHTYRKKDYPVVADAISLVREQVEKIFTIALLLQNPPKWITQYLRNDYRKHYEEWLLEREELGNIPRFYEHLHKDFPAFLETIRKPPVQPPIGPEILVSRFAERVLNYHWNNPGGKNPTWFKRKQAVRNYLNDYFEFPTPGTAAKMIKDSTQRKFLYRWHKEYQYLCAYTHVALGKILLQSMNEFKNMDAAEKVVILGEKQAHRALFTSFAAAASACALVINSVSNAYGAKTSLRNFWEELANSSLMCKPFWDMYIKAILR